MASNSGGQAGGQGADHGSNGIPGVKMPPFVDAHSHRRSAAWSPRYPRAGHSSRLDQDSSPVVDPAAYEHLEDDGRFRWQAQYEEAKEPAGFDFRWQQQDSPESGWSAGTELHERVSPGARNYDLFPATPNFDRYFGPYREPQSMPGAFKEEVLFRMDSANPVEQQRDMEQAVIFTELAASQMIQRDIRKGAEYTHPMYEDSVARPQNMLGELMKGQDMGYGAYAKQVKYGTRFMLCFGAGPVFAIAAEALTYDPSLSRIQNPLLRRRMWLKKWRNVALRGFRRSLALGFIYTVLENKGPPIVRRVGRTLRRYIPEYLVPPNRTMENFIPPFITAGVAVAMVNRQRNVNIRSWIKTVAFSSLFCGTMLGALAFELESGINLQGWDVQREQWKLDRANRSKISEMPEHMRIPLAADTMEFYRRHNWILRPMLMKKLREIDAKDRAIHELGKTPHPWDT